MNFVKYGIVTVIPAHQIEKNIESVVNGPPCFIKHGNVVNAAHPDPFADCNSTLRKVLSRLIKP